MNRPVAAAVAFREVLEQNPSDQETTFWLFSIYQNELFDYQAAYQLAESSSDPVVTVHLVEPLFATGRLEEALTFTQLLTSSFTQIPALELVFRGYEVATLLADSRVEEAAAALQELRQRAASWPADFRPNWTYSGTRHYVSRADELPHREALELLFTVLESEDRESLLRGLQQLDLKLQPLPVEE